MSGRGRAASICLDRHIQAEKNGPMAFAVLAEPSRRADPRPAAGRRALGGRAGRRPGAQPARGLQTPAGAARGRTGRRPARRPAPPLPPGARGLAEVADWLEPYRRLWSAPASTPSRPTSTASEVGGERDTGGGGGRPVRRCASSASLAHRVDRVWRAMTEPGELAHWFPGRGRGHWRGRRPGHLLQPRPGRRPRPAAQRRRGHRVRPAPAAGLHLGGRPAADRARA